MINIGLVGRMSSVMPSSRDPKLEPLRPSRPATASRAAHEVGRSREGYTGSMNSTLTVLHFQAARSSGEQANRIIFQGTARSEGGDNTYTARRCSKVHLRCTSPRTRRCS